MQSASKQYVLYFARFGLIFEKMTQVETHHLPTIIKFI